MLVWQLLGSEALRVAQDLLQVGPETADEIRPIRVIFTVKNTGTWAGAEIAQVHLSLSASTGEPPKRLVGWAKVELEPGETREASVTLDPNATSRPLSYWNVNTNSWEITTGDYQVYVGASRATSASLDPYVSTETHQPNFSPLKRGRKKRCQPPLPLSKRIHANSEKVK